MCQKQDKGFKFDEMHIIESLPEEERTGKVLEQSLKGMEKPVLGPEKIHYHYVFSKSDLTNLLIDISLNASNTYPIIHFEIHGCENGLYMHSGEVFSWKELAVYLRFINVITKNNLFITMAVCFGARLLAALDGRLPSPCWGFVGSFEPLIVENLMICYNRFYKTFLTNYDVNESLKVLAAEHHDWIEKNRARLEKNKENLKENGFDIEQLEKYEYRFVYSEEIFRKISTNILKEDVSSIETRFEHYWTTGEIPHVNDKKEMKETFVKESLARRKPSIEKMANSFFMTKYIPENADVVKEIMESV